MNWIPILQPEKFSIQPDIDPQSILVNPECQPRKDGTDDVRVAEYALEMGSDNPFGWGKFPRIRCVKDENGFFYLYSGFHRLEAMLRNKYETIEIEYVDGTYSDAVMLSKCENADHGVRRTNADKEYVVMSCLQDTELRRWSNEQIAKWCAVDPKTVANYEARLSGNSRDDGEPYTRPAVRLFLKKDGTIGEKDTSEIGKRNGNQSEATDENQLTLDADIQGQALAGLTEARSAFRTACNNFEALPELGHLPNGYTLRRVRSLVGIVNEDPRDWGTEYINIQASLCSDAAMVIENDTNGYDSVIQSALDKITEVRSRFREHWKQEREEFGLPPDTQLDEQSLDELLGEIRRVTQVLELYTVLKSPHLQFPLDEGTAPAVAEVDAILTADWEAKSPDKRLAYLQRLIKLQPVLYKSECELRDEAEKERLKIQLDEARAETWETVKEFQKTFTLSDLQLPLSEFLPIAAKHFNYDVEILNILVGEDARSKKKRRELSLKELRAWKSRLNTLTTAIKQKAEAFATLRPRPKECLKELKGYLHRQGTPAFEEMIETTWVDLYKLTPSVFAKLKMQAIEDGCQYYRDQNIEIRQQVAALFIEDEEISASDLTLTDIEARAVEVYENLTPETFSGAHDKDDFNDYDLLVKENTSLTAYVEALRNKHDWVQALLPKSIAQTEECFAEMQEHFEQEHTFDNLDFVKVASLFKCDLETVNQNAQTIREKALKVKQVLHEFQRNAVDEAFMGSELKNALTYEKFQAIISERYQLRRDVFTGGTAGIGYLSLISECEILARIEEEIKTPADWVQALLSGQPNWSRLRNLAGEIITELGDLTPEEDTKAKELTDEIHKVMNAYTSLDRRAKLWVLAQIAWNLMAEMEG